TVIGVIVVPAAYLGNVARTLLERLRGEAGAGVLHGVSEEAHTVPYPFGDQWRVEAGVDALHDAVELMVLEWLRRRVEANTERVLHLVGGTRCSKEATDEIVVGGRRQVVLRKVLLLVHLAVGKEAVHGGSAVVLDPGDERG